MFTSLRRGLPRILVLLAAGVLLLLVAHLPELAGLTGGVMPTLAPVAFGFGLVLVGLAVGDAALRVLQPRVDAQAAALDAHRTGSVAAGLVYVGRCVLAAAILLLFVTSARADAPAAALPLLPVLHAQQIAYWPGMPMPSTLGAQTEQETCPSLKSRSCWNTHAELHTSREQGVGLGQLTRAFRADGSTRFDALQEMVDAHPKDLAGLSWTNRYDAALQLRALVLKDHDGFQRILNTASPQDRLAMAFSAYNGGLGGVLSDRRMCAATAGCNPGIWFGNVERTSLKAKTAVPGYGASFFSVNRTYVVNVMRVRRVRYLALDT